MIVSAAIVPHSPLLVPTIGVAQTLKLTETLQAYETVARQLQTQAPDTLIMISPHGLVLPDASVINLSETYVGELTEFGDLNTRIEYRSDSELIDRLQRLLRAKQEPITLISTPAMDYGLTVPLSLLRIPRQTKLIPFTPGALDAKTIFNTAEDMKEVLSATGKRVGIIASADLSHRLSTDAPMGFSPRAQAFDEAVRESIETKNSSRLLRTDLELVREVGACGFSPIISLLGILAGMETTARTLAYEHPFGVGYLTVQYEFE